MKQYSDTTREGFAAIRTSQYRPTVASQSARPESHMRSAHSDDHPSLFSGMRPGRGGCRQRKGYSFSFAIYDEDSEKEIQYLRLLQRHRVAKDFGFLRFGPADSSPVNGVGIQSCADREPRPQLSPDRDRFRLGVNESEIQRRCNHLLGLGHRRIGFITRHLKTSPKCGSKDSREFYDADLPIRPEYLIAVV